MADPWTHHTLQVNGFRMHYVIAGSGYPLVFLHGWPQTWYEWRKIIPPLAGRFTLIAPDLRGLGDSERPLTGYDKRTLASDVYQLAISLGYAKIGLTGHDWGGTVAYYLAYDHPIPELIKAGGGSIVNMASVAALRGSFPLHVYVAAKGAIISFTKALAGEYAKHNIRANAICPGMVLTERIKQRFGPGSPQAEAMQAQFQNYPFAVGEPEDIASIALFLASDESRMITGAILPADGGLSAY